MLRISKNEEYWYKTPTRARPGQRCAAVKHELQDRVLTVIALVTVNPFDFKRRRYLRKFLSDPAHKIDSRHYYRKIRTLPARKVQPLFDWYLARNPELAKHFKGMKHTNYTAYKWDWLYKKIAQRDEDPRAVCVDVIFTVSWQQNILNPAALKITCYLPETGRRFARPVRSIFTSDMPSVCNFRSA